MSLVYNFLIFFLQSAYFFAGLFNPKARNFNTGRKGLLKKLARDFETNTQPVIWVHCASLGEFEQGRPVIEQFKRELPEYKIVLTFFSPSGYEVRKNYPYADYICYLPWDTKLNAKIFIESIKPALAIFVKYEFWHHYTCVLQQKKIPIISASAIFRESQLFFKSYGSFYLNILKRFTYFFVQNDTSIRLLKSVGISNCSRAGDTRFDRVHQLVTSGEEIGIAKEFKGTDKTMVIGSCWPEDLDVLIPFINENYHFLKFIVAPHEISESFISDLEKGLNAETIRYSQADSKKLSECQVLIIDNIGMLGKLYRYGEFAYVGGAFGKGLHNILEAACYGIPVFFGNKNYEKFQEATDLINRGGAFEIGDYRELKAKYEMVNLPQSFLLACEVTRQYVEENLGATNKIVGYCKTLLSKS